MWYAQPQRLVLLLGVCIYILGLIAGSAEAGRMKTGVRSRKPSRKSSSKVVRGSKKLAKPPFTVSKSRKSKSSSKRSKHKSSKKTKGKGKTVLTGFKMQIGVYQPKPPSCSKASVETTSSVEMNCLSCKTKIYRECPVAGTTKITDVNYLCANPPQICLVVLVVAIIVCPM